MPPARPLQHVDAEKKEDDVLRAEARNHLAESPSIQLIAEILAKLRAGDLPFWTPIMLRERWNATERMRWYRQRPDLRQKITTGLTGLAPKAARKKMADFQAALIDSVIDEGDVPVRTFEDSFDVSDLAIYGPAAGFWHTMREVFPWKSDTGVHQEIMAWMLKALLADSSSIPGIARVPILTPWDLRTAIEGRVWHTKIPLEVRVAIDDARFSQERDRPGVPFHAQDDLAIAAADIIAASVPLRDLAGVLDAAERAMGFDKDKDTARSKAPADVKAPAEVPIRKSGASDSTTPSTMPPPVSSPAGAMSMPAPTTMATPTSPSAMAPPPAGPGAPPVSPAVVSTSPAGASGPEAASAPPAAAPGANASPGNAAPGNAPPGANAPPAPPAVVNAPMSTPPVSSPAPSNAGPPPPHPSQPGTAPTGAAPSPPPLVTPPAMTPPPISSPQGASSRHGSVPPPPPAPSGPPPLPPGMLVPGPVSGHLPGGPLPPMVAALMSAPVQVSGPAPQGPPPPPMMNPPAPGGPMPPAGAGGGGPVTPPPMATPSGPPTGRSGPAQPAQGAPPPAERVPEPRRRMGSIAGVPTLEDELERTNPWVTPTGDELAAALEQPINDDTEAHQPNNRRRRRS